MVLLVPTLYCLRDLQKLLLLVFGCFLTILSEFHCLSCSLKSSVLQKIEETTINGSNLYKQEILLFLKDNGICFKLNIYLSNKNMYVLMTHLLRQELCSVKEFTEDSNSSSEDRKIIEHRDLIFLLSFLQCQKPLSILWKRFLKILLAVINIFKPDIIRILVFT